jgi:EmrB/QacA subfamily drug resistance transporter
MTMFLTNLDVSIVFIALPTLTKFFSVSAGDVSWVILAYLLSICAFGLIAGRLIDFFGTRRMFIIGNIIFVVASILCALSVNFPMLIASRFIQGMGASILFAISSTIIVLHLPETVRGRSFGFNTVSGAAGVAFGAPLGGILIAFVGWEYIFLINIPICNVSMLLIGLYIKKAEPIIFRWNDLDLRGSIYSILAISPLLYALNEGSGMGWTSLPVLSMFGVSSVFMVLFFVHEMKAKTPLLDPRHLKNINLSLSLFSTLMVVIAMNACNFVFPFFLEQLKLFSIEKIGMILSVLPLAAMITGPFAGLMVDKLNERVTNVVAMAVALIATGLFTLYTAESGNLLLLGGLFLFGAGVAAFMTANVNLIMSHAPAGEEGSISSLLSEGTFIGAALGICIAQSLYTYGAKSAPVVTDSVLGGYQLVAALAVFAIAAALVTTFFTTAKANS